MGETLAYPMQAGAKTATRVMGGLLCVLILTLPFGIWMFVRAARSKTVIGVDALTSKRFFGTRVLLTEVQRFGVLKVTVAGGGIGGMLARKMCGGPVATNVCFQLRNGKTKTYMASAFERPEEQIGNLAAALKLPVEELSQGFKGPKWPVRDAA